MKFDFNESIDNFLKIIVECAQKNNINVYFVGGIVRDNILKIPTNDIDLIIDSNAIEFVKLLPDEIKLKSVHKEFCTVKIEYNGVNFDIASTRTETYPHSGCLPNVVQVGVDIKQDYIRRDFSVNSLYCKISLIDDCLVYDLIDYSYGIEDIKNKVLKVLHDKSYIDDPTRIIRGVGFKYRFDFDFSEHDKKLITNFFQNFNLEYASIDRIESVFKHVLSGVNSDKIFKDIVLNKYFKLINSQELNIDIEFIDRIIVDFNLSDKSDFYMHVLKNIDVSHNESDNLLDIKKYFSKMPVSNLAYYYYKTRDNSVIQYLKIKDINLLINGSDLLSYGFKQGKELGEILDSLLSFKLENPAMLLSKDDEINWIKNNF